MATPDIVSYNGSRTFSGIDSKDLADKLLRVRRLTLFFTAVLYDTTPRLSSIDSDVSA